MTQFKMVDEQADGPHSEGDGESSNISLVTRAAAESSAPELSPLITYPGTVAHRLSPGEHVAGARDSPPDLLTVTSHTAKEPPAEGDPRIGSGGKSAASACSCYCLTSLCGRLRPAGWFGELLTEGLVVLTLWTVAYLLLGEYRTI